MPTKSKILNIAKKGIHIIELCDNNRCKKNQANIFIFGCAMAQEPDAGNDVTFETQFFLNF